MSQHPAWVADLLAAGEVYEVGGSVRDRLLGGNAAPASKDADYLVRAVPLPEVQKILRRHGAVNLVGKSFGVIKFTPASGEDDAVTYDVALPRRERSTGVGHTEFEVDFDPELPLEVDLRRRDFTINAMAVDCRTGDLFDPLGGRGDLESRLLRMVFPHAFSDDPLRILRGAQFAARFDLTVESGTLDAMRAAAPLVETLSSERVAEELTKLLTCSPKPSIGLRLLQELGVVKRLLPELEDTVGIDQPGGYHAYNVFDHSLHTVDAAPPRLRLRLAGLLHDVNKPQCKVVVGEKATFYGHDRKGARTARRILSRLRFPRELTEEVSLLVDQHMFTADISDKGVRRLIRRLGRELIYDLLDLRRADVVAQGMGGTTEDIDELEIRITGEINHKRPFGREDLAVDGRDLMEELRITPGPQIGKVLEGLLEAVLDDPDLNTREELLALARKLLSDKGQHLT